MVFCPKGHVIKLPKANADGSFKPMICWACVAGA